MSKTIRIILADDHPIYRDGLRLMISNDPGIEVIAETANGREAVEVIKEAEPDVALLDVDMPLLDGPGVARECRDLGLSTGLIFVTLHRDHQLLQQSLDLGVKGYLLKSAKANEVIEAIQTVASGDHYMSPAVSSLLVERVQTGRQLNTVKEGLDSLTKAELKVLRLIATDRTSKEIADDLGLSVRTIESHRSRICAKLDLHGVHSLVKFAFEHRDKL